MDSTIAVDFLLAGCGGICVIVDTFCAWTIKQGRQNRLGRALRKKLLGFKVDLHAFWDLFSWPGLGIWGSWFGSTLQGLLTCSCLFVCFHSGHSAGPLHSIQSLKCSHTDVLASQAWSRRSSNAVDSEDDQTVSSSEVCDLQSSRSGPTSPK